MNKHNLTIMERPHCYRKSYAISHCYLALCSGDLPALPQWKLVLDLATPEGCKAELTWVEVISQDSLRATGGHLSQK